MAAEVAEKGGNQTELTQRRQLVVEVLVMRLGDWTFNVCEVSLLYIREQLELRRLLIRIVTRAAPDVDRRKTSAAPL